MALSQQQKIDCRRHLSVPAAGIPQSGYTAGLRSILTVGQLEAYMDLLQAEEECVLTGYPYGQVNIFGAPQVGNTVTATINSTPVIYTVQASDVSNGQSLNAIAGGLATKINIANLGIYAASGSITSGDVVPAALPIYGQVTIVNQTTFTLSASATGQLGTSVPANGSVYPHPNTVNIQGAPTLYGYIPILNYLEERILQQDTFASFSATGEVKFNPYELYRRIETYDVWRKKLGNFLSVGPDPAGKNGMGSGFGIKV